MSANSVLPPLDGNTACSGEYFAGVALNELSECHRRLPIAKSRRRSSRANSLLSLSRFDTSANVVGSGTHRAPAGSFRPPLDLAKAPREGEVLRVIDVLVVKNEHGVLSIPAWMAATSSGVSGRRRSMPSTSAAKHGPTWRILTGIGGLPQLEGRDIGDVTSSCCARKCSTISQPVARHTPACEQM